MPAGNFAGATSYCTANDSVVSPKFQPVLSATTLAAAIDGELANFFSRNAMVGSSGRPYIHETKPRANMFFARLASLRDSSNSFTASTVMPVRSTAWTWKSASMSSGWPSSSSGFASYPALLRLRAEKSAVSTTIVAPLCRSDTFAFSAAGFMATRTSGVSPAVRMSWSAKWIWKDETPGIVP